MGEEMPVRMNPQLLSAEWMEALKERRRPPIHQIPAVVRSHFVLHADYIGACRQAGEVQYRRASGRIACARRSASAKSGRLNDYRSPKSTMD